MTGRTVTEVQGVTWNCGNQMDTKGEAQAAHTEGESTEAKGLAHSSAP
jgi:hypothetical protein